MSYFLVRWEIDIEADDPVEAAEQALRFQRDPESEATVFDVISGDDQVTRVDVDVTGTHVLQTTTKEGA